MINLENEPKKYDVVLGGKSQPLPGSLVLGGLEALKGRLTSPFPQERLKALWETTKYGSKGLDCVIGALQDPQSQVQIAAYKILRQATGSRVEQALQTFNPYPFFQCLYTFENLSCAYGTHAITPDGKSLLVYVYKGLSQDAQGKDCKILCLQWHLNWTKFPNLHWLYPEFLPVHSVCFSNSSPDPINTLVMTPDSRFLAVAGKSDNPLGDTRIDVIDLENMKTLYHFYGHNRRGKRQNNCLALSKNGKILVSGSEDKTTIIWDLTRGCQTYTLRGHSHAITALGLSPEGDILATGSQDYTIKLWDVNTGQLLYNIKEHSGAIAVLCISDNGEILVSGDREGSIKVWDLKTGQKKSDLSFPHGAIGSLTLSLDGKLLLGCGTSYWGSPIYIWSLTTGALLTILETTPNQGGEKTSRDRILGITISPDNQMIVTRSYGDIKIWGVP
jgi:WD40 repeat protein